MQRAQKFDFGLFWEELFVSLKHTALKLIHRFRGNKNEFAQCEKL